MNSLDALLKAPAAAPGATVSGTVPGTVRPGLPVPASASASCPDSCHTSFQSELEAVEASARAGSGAATGGASGSVAGGTVADPAALEPAVFMMPPVADAAALPSDGRPLDLPEPIAGPASWPEGPPASHEPVRPALHYALSEVRPTTPASADQAHQPGP